MASVHSLSDEDWGRQQEAQSRQGTHALHPCLTRAEIDSYWTALFSDNEQQSQHAWDDDRP